MPSLATNAIALHYESFGAARDPAILLIMGLGAQLTRWNSGLCELLVKRGFRVLRFDNRDCGLSTRCAARPYTLETMAADSVGLLDALGIDRAHLVGASMGAAIAQIIAAHYPHKTLSLTSIMSTSGNPLLPPPTPAAAMALFAPLPALRDRASIVADAIARYLPLASPGYPTPLPDLQRIFGDEYDRGFYPPGVARQLGAVIAGGDRRALLGRIACPTVVLHGRNDPLILPACAQDVAGNIAQAKLRLIDGMGHDFPAALTPTFADAICAAAATPRSATS
jgi:pimeloyl-ACP methyl ester carboxylesterase